MRECVLSDQPREFSEFRWIRASSVSKLVSITGLHGEAVPVHLAKRQATPLPTPCIWVRTVDRQLRCYEEEETGYMLSVTYCLLCISAPSELNDTDMD